MTSSKPSLSILVIFTMFSLIDKAMTVTDYINQ